jgi:flagellar protein FlaG
MDIKASPPVSSVAASPPDQGKGTVLPVATGKQVPAPAPTGRIDPVVEQSQQERQAAVARRVNDYLRSVSRDLEFQVDDSGKAVITVRDGSGNVVRRIPDEEALQMLRRANVESGTFVDSVV